MHNVTALVPSVFKRPGGHFVHVERPPASANCPFAQNEHVPLPKAAWKVPAGQSAHSRTAAFSSAFLKRPGGHNEHSVAPLMSVYLPLPHTTHSAFSRSAWNLPNSHSLQAVSPVASWYRPSGHWEHVTVPSSFVKRPCGHLSQAVASPSAAWKRATGHKCDWVSPIRAQM